MADPKSYEPEKLTTGVTWKSKKTISDYPASEWTLTYYLRKSAATTTSLAQGTHNLTPSSSTEQHRYVLELIPTAHSA